MNDRIDLLWRFYDQENVLLMNEESQRSTATNLILVMATAVLGILGWNKSLTMSQLPLAIFLVFIGVLGVLFALKYRHSRAWHENVKLEYLRAITSAQDTSGADVGDLRDNAAAEIDKKYYIMAKIPKWLLWTIPSFLVAGIGLILIWIIYLG